MLLLLASPAKAAPRDGSQAPLKYASPPAGTRQRITTGTLLLLYALAMSLRSTPEISASRVDARYTAKDPSVPNDPCDAKRRSQGHRR